MPLTRLLNGLISKEWDLMNSRVTVQESPTALIIDSNLGYVFRSTAMSKWIWVQEGSFPRHSYAKEASSGDTCRAATGFWGVQPPFFVIPSFMFKCSFQVVLLRSFRHSLMRWPGILYPKQFWFFFWYNSTVFAKWMIYPTDWSAPPTPLRLLPPFQLKTLPLLPLLASHLSFIVSYCSRLSSESMIALQLLGGKQIPWCLRMSCIHSASWGCLGQ